MRLQSRVTACEDTQDVKGMVLERFKASYTNNDRVLPKNIICYRDGVSDT
jgi:eukaryotic translation initiation factor 2C